MNLAEYDTLIPKKKLRFNNQRMIYLNTMSPTKCIDECFSIRLHVFLDLIFSLLITVRDVFNDWNERSTDL